MRRSHGLTVGVSSRRSPAFFRRYRQHLLQTAGVAQIQLCMVYNAGQFSLAQIYNQILEQARFQIVCLLHDDLIFLRNRGWGRQVIRHFQRNPEFAILGVAGALGFEEHGVAWSPPQNMLGRLWHQDPVTDRFFLSDFSGDFGDTLIEALTLDGLFLALHLHRTSVRFNTELSGFHFYDVQLTIDNWLLHKNTSIACKNGIMTNIRLKHLSTGTLDQAFDHYRQMTIKKYEKYLPLQQPFSLFQVQLPSKRQTQSKLAVILLHLAEDLLIEPCWQALSSLTEQNISIFYVGRIFQPPHLKFDEKNLTFIPSDFCLHDFSLSHAVSEALSFVPLEQFDWVLIWDTRIIPQVYALEALLAFAERPHALPLGTVGLRLHYTDYRVYFAGLDMLRDQSGQVHCLYHGIHSAFRHSFASTPTPYNHLGFTLMSARHLKDPGDLASGQNWIPGLELNLNCLKKGYFNFLQSHLVGIYRESLLDLSVPVSKLEQAYSQFQVNFPNWLSQNGNSADIQAWVRSAPVIHRKRGKI